MKATPDTGSYWHRARSRWRARGSDDRRFTALALLAAIYGTVTSYESNRTIYTVVAVVAYAVASVHRRLGAVERR